ncbi:MAG: hypothetical protein ABIE07_09510 [Candidatus Zixiibacteriota bacterium]
MESKMLMLFVGLDESENKNALSELESLPGFRVKVMAVPKVAANYFRMPFIELPQGERHFGLKGILEYVSRVRQTV